ncbi:MAG: hypothetical protein KAR38_00790 [Calditrichia bacterium]|nr:hypothetical protein [Calditrichia bacterium]
MIKYLLLTILFSFSALFSQSTYKIPVNKPFKEKKFLNFYPDSTKLDSSISFLVGRNLIEMPQNNNVLINSYKCLLKDDSLKINITKVQFSKVIIAYEYYCHYFFIEEEKNMELSWFTIIWNDSLAISWYKKDIYFIKSSGENKKEFKKILKSILYSTDDLKNLPDFIKAFPEDDKIKNSMKISTSPFLQQNYFKQTYFADYEAKGSISRIYIIPISRDSIFIHFHNFRNFWKDRGLLGKQEIPLELSYFVAQDVFLGNMLCVLYQDYIIGIMNYPSNDWAKDYLEKVRKNLKKHPIKFE